ncbi:transposase [Actinoplanes sp. N902-109]|nr:transposase [Actinoplanes sp. N902-109]
MKEHDQPHVVATGRNDDVVTTSMRFARVNKLVASLPGRSWYKMSAGAGALKPRKPISGRCVHRGRCYRDSAISAGVSSLPNRSVSECAKPI